MERGDTKSIRVSIKTYERLAKLGDLRDSFDSVLNNIMNENTTFKRLYGKEKERVPPSHYQKLEPTVGEDIIKND